VRTIEQAPADEKGKKKRRRKERRRD